MKTPEELRSKAEELLAEKGIKRNTPFHNYEYLYRSVIDVIADALLTALSNQK